jgi:hypothetical protein
MMNFQWSNETSQDLAKTFSSAIKYRGGFFASFAQAKYLLNAQTFQRRTDAASLKSFFNVNIQPGQMAVEVGGYSQFGNYGTRGIRPSTWYYVIDQLGVVAKYKLKYKGDMKTGTCPDPTKTILEWTRTSTETPAWNSVEEQAKREAADKAIAKTNREKSWLGAEGTKLAEDFPVKLVKIIDGGPGAYGYNWTSVFETQEGDTIYWHNLPPFGTNEGYAQEGDEYVITRMTIKKLITNRKGIKGTVINRPSFKK